MNYIKSIFLCRGQHNYQWVDYNDYDLTFYECTCCGKQGNTDEGMKILEERRCS